MIKSFNVFLENISITSKHGDTADGRRDSVYRLLTKKFHILSALATGSLVRGTALKGYADIDVMLTLHYSKHLQNKTPLQVLESVREALSDYNAKIIKKNGQAVTLYFTTWPNVDIVPVKRVGTDQNYVLQIPDMNTGNWITTDPASHDKMMSFVPLRRRQLVTMVKCWNKAHSSYLQSFHIEQIALQTTAAMDGMVWGEADWPWALVDFFEKALAMTGPYDEISKSYDVDEWVQLRSRLTRARDLAAAAWFAVYDKNDTKTAIEKCGVLFGGKFPSYG